jgi:hypothetical protein
MDKVDGTDADKSECIKLDFLMDHDNPASKYSQQFSIFKDGLDQVGDGLPRDLDPDAYGASCSQYQYVSDFFEGSSLFLF